VTQAQITSSSSRAAEPGGNGAASSSSVAPVAEGGSPEAARPRRMNPIKLRQMQERASELEEEITKLEAGIAESERELLTFVRAAETARVSALLEQRKRELAERMAEWEEVSAVIEG